jgi:hypothetical protein
LFFDSCVALKQIRSRAALDDGYIDALAATQNFEDAWFDANNQRVPKAKAKAGAAPVQQPVAQGAGLPAGQRLLNFAQPAQPEGQGAGPGVSALAARPKPSPVMPPPTVTSPPPAPTAGRTVSAPPVSASQIPVTVAAPAEVANVEPSPSEPSPSVAPPANAGANPESPIQSHEAVGLNVPADMRDGIADDAQLNLESSTEHHDDANVAGHDSDLDGLNFVLTLLSMSYYYVLYSWLCNLKVI